MKFDILVNHYFEPVCILERLLESIEKQEDIDKNSFQVIIYDDGGACPINKKIFDKYSYNITYAILNHGGVCKTRNALLNDSKADYVMFCDSDDCFIKANGLALIFKAIEDVHPNVIGSPYYVENKINDKYSYSILERDNLRVHGKAFKRDFLVSNNIAFPNELEYSGDMYFLWLALNVDPFIVWLKKAFYVWKYNPESVTRKNKNHHIDSYDKVIKNYDLLITNLEKRMQYDLYERAIVAFIQMLYLNINDKTLSKYDNNSLKKMKDLTKEYAMKYSNTYLCADEKLKEIMLSKAINNGVTVDNISNWIAQIKMGGE